MIDYRFKCCECGHVFEPDEARKHRYIGGETESFCPLCDNDEFDDVAQCDDCGEWFEPNELYGGAGDLYCESCLEKKADRETAFHIGRDNPTEINGFFEQFFTAEEIEAILLAALEERKTGEQITTEATAYCMADPHYFADWLIHHGEEEQTWQEKTRLSTG